MKGMVLKMIKILEKFDTAKNILITSHENPDGDAVGTSLALLLALNKLNFKYELEKRKIIRLVLQDEIPSFLKFLEHNFLVEKYDNIDKNVKFDLVIAVDSAELERIGKVKELIGKESFLINIDHHISNKGYGDINVVDFEKSSTAEIIYEIIKEMEVEIDKDIGEAIYCGIINDTGNFSYSNVTEKTFLIAAELKKLGIDNEKAAENLFYKKSKSRLKALGIALENMQFYEEKKLNFFFLSDEEMKKYGIKKEDTEGIVEALRSFSECDTALFLREENDGFSKIIKGSFRSKESDVNVLAAMFGGGGHKKAAGFKTVKTKEEILEMVLKKL